MSRLHALLTLLGAILVAPVPAATLLVDRLDDGVDALPGDGSCAIAGSDTQRCTLRAAIQEANASVDGIDTIQLPAGTILLSIGGAEEDTAAAGDLDIAATLNLVGAAEGGSVVQQQALDRIFDLQPGTTASLSRLRLRGGGAVDGGGALRNQGQLTIADAEIDGNGGDSRPVRFGGAIFNAGVLALTAVDLHDNQAGSSQMAGAAGGALYNTLGAVLTGVRLVGNRVLGSTGSGGGLAQVTPAITQLVRCEVVDNQAFAGAGAALTGGSLLLSASTFHRQRALSAGGAVRMTAGTLEAVNSTFSDNHAGTDGGALWLGSGTLKLRNVTLSTNLADADGNGSGNGGGIAATAQLQVDLRHSVLAGNADSGGQAPECSGPLASAGFNLIGAILGCSWTAAAGDPAPQAPLLDALGDHGGSLPTHAPLPGSPLIDTGDPAGCTALNDTPLPLDQRNLGRPQDGDGNGDPRCDLGAVEYLPDALLTDGFEAPD